MNGRRNAEAMAALALLPIGGVLALLSALAFVALGLAALLLPFLGRGPGWGWLELWLLAATLVCVRNTVGALEVVSSLSWRPMLVTLAWIAGVVVACPIWWLGGHGGAF